MKKSEIPEKKLCRLCGKQKEEKEFTEFTLTMIRKMAVRYRGCKSCGVVIHNASILIRETILQGVKEHESGLALREKTRITPSPMGN